MGTFVFAAVLAMLPMSGSAMSKPPTNGMIKVAFAISKQANVMDIAGPWEVFADTSFKDAHGKDIAPYQLYTVSASKAPLRSAGANQPGLTITPDYDFAMRQCPTSWWCPRNRAAPNWRHG